MFKSQLQELCQRRQWRLPEYTASFEGPDHCRRFRATVVVEDLSFESPADSMSSKEAQNQAARVALDHFNAASPPPTASLPSAAAEGQVPYKTQLQQFAQKKKCELPVYECTREGPHHCPRFKAIVRVYGQTFESSQFFSSSKAAEHSAAGAALMSLASDEESASSLQERVEEDAGVYKSLLQQLAQKKRFPPPNYMTLINGLSQMPRFSSIVEVQGQRFEGGSAKTKRQAEGNAAKVAWDHFQSMSCSTSSVISKVKLTYSPPASKIWRKIEEGISNVSGVHSEVGGAGVMYKSQLQELCQRRQWRFPEYTASFEGPEHCRRFRATVIVEDLSFESPGDLMSSNEAESQAARVALDHFNAASSPPAALPSAAAVEGQVPYKTQLQQFAQKKKCELPVYECTREGPHHCPRFKATVRVFGQTFESSQFFNSSKAAEHSAAGVALMSLASEEESECVEEDTGVYKSLLHQLAQKERFSPPNYINLISGLSHMPHFSSIVEVQGLRFEGGSAKTKRLADCNAAKVAWDHFQSMSSTSSVTSKVKLTYCPPASKLWRKIEEGVSNVSDSKEVSYSDEASQKASSSGVVPVEGCKPRVNPETNSNNDASAVAVITEFLSQKPDAKFGTIDEEAPSGTSFPVSSGDIDALPSAEDAEMPQGSGSFSSPSNMVFVYPRNPAVIPPEGVIELPFSDNKWVAVSLDF